MSRSRARAAFTLLEVLAAVAVLGILFTVLARAAAQGLRAEGDSRRRMEAGLLAERTLAELESAWALGAPPPESATEFEEDDFLVRVTVADAELEPLLALAAEDEDDGARRRGDDPAGFLADRDPRRPSAVQRVLVEVVWDDGIQERRVMRRTYAFDRAAVAGQLLGAAEEEADAGAEGAE